MASLSYDPTEFSSPEDYARSHAQLDREHGMPHQAYSGEVGQLVNKEHARRQADMNNELGWCGSTPEQLRKKWNI